MQLPVAECECRVYGVQTRTPHCSTLHCRPYGQLDHGCAVDVDDSSLYSGSDAVGTWTGEISRNRETRNGASTDTESGSQEAEVAHR